MAAALNRAVQDGAIRPSATSAMKGASDRAPVLDGARGRHKEQTWAWAKNLGSNTTERASFAIVSFPTALPESVPRGWSRLAAAARLAGIAGYSVDHGFDGSHLSAALDGVICAIITPPVPAPKRVRRKADEA